MGEVVAAVVVAVGWLAAGSAAATALAAVVNLALAAAAAAYSAAKARDQKAAARKAQRRAQMETQQRNSFRNFRQPLAARRVVYGRARVAGPFVFAHNPNEGTMAHLVVALAGHEIDAIEEYFILNDEVLVSTVPGTGYGRVSGKYTRNVIIWPFLGTSTQDIGAKMRTATDVRPNGGGADISLDIITANDKFAGIAALYIVTHKFGADLEGAQPDFAARVRGKKLYDPRTETTAWSENPALAAYDWLVNVMGFPPSSIHLPTLEAAADACDDLVPLFDGTTHKRYTIGGIIDADTEHREALDLIAETMAGAIRYSSGQWFIEAGVPVEPVETVFHEDMILGSYELEIERPAHSLPNAVRGNFFDEVTSQPMSFPQWVPDYAEGQKLNWLDVELPLVTNHIRAQRIARIMLGQARARRSLSLEFDLRGLLVRPGDVIPFSAPELGIDAEPFLVDGFTLSRQDLGGGPVLTTRLDLIDYDPSIYDWNPATDEQQLERGTVNLVPIVGKDFGKLIYTETDYLWANRIFSANYNFEWLGALHEPAEGTPTHLVLTVTVTIAVQAGHYTTGQKKTVTATIAYTGSAGSATLPFSSMQFASGATLSSRTIKDAFVQVKFSDGSFGPVINATYI